jgi:hypothetical protein
MEATTEGSERADRKHFIFGRIAGVTPCVAILFVGWAYSAPVNQSGRPVLNRTPGAGSTGVSRRRRE